MIVGGEDRPKARHMEEEWVRNILNECKTARVPFFFKQWGGRNSKAGGRLLDDRVWGEMPELVLNEKMQRV